MNEYMPPMRFSIKSFPLRAKSWLRKLRIWSAGSLRQHLSTVEYNFQLIFLHRRQRTAGGLTTCMGSPNPLDLKYLCPNFAFICAKPGGHAKVCKICKIWGEFVNLHKNVKILPRWESNSKRLRDRRPC